MRNTKDYQELANIKDDLLMEIQGTHGVKDTLPIVLQRSIVITRADLKPPKLKWP